MARMFVMRVLEAQPEARLLERTRPYGNGGSGRRLKVCRYQFVRRLIGVEGNAARGRQIGGSGVEYLGTNGGGQKNSPSEGLLGRSCRRVETARQSPTATGTAKPPPRRMVQKRMRRRLRPAPLFHQRNSGNGGTSLPPGRSLRQERSFAEGFKYPPCWRLT